MQQAIFATSVILLGLSAFVIGLIIYGFKTISKSNFRTIKKIIIFNLLNIMALSFIVFLLSTYGFSSVDISVKLLVVLLGTIQIYMAYNSVLIYKHNKASNRIGAKNVPPG